MSKIDPNEVIAKLIATEEGRKKIGETMSNYICEHLYRPSVTGYNLVPEFANFKMPNVKIPDLPIYDWMNMDGTGLVHQTTDDINKQLNQTILGTFDGYGPATTNISAISLSVTKLQDGKAFVILDAPIIVSCHWCEERGKYVVCNAAKSQPCLYCQVGNSVRLRFFMPIRYRDEPGKPSPKIEIVEISESVYNDYRSNLKIAIEDADVESMIWFWNICEVKYKFSRLKYVGRKELHINNYLEEYSQIKHSLQQPVEDYLKQENRIVEYKNDVYVIEIVDEHNKVFGKIEHVPCPLLWLLGFSVNPNNRDLKLNCLHRKRSNSLGYYTWYLPIEEVLNYDWTQSVEMFFYVPDVKENFFLFEGEWIQHGYPFGQMNFDIPKMFDTKNVVRISRNFHLHELAGINIMLPLHNKASNATLFMTFPSAGTWLKFFYSLNKELHLTEGAKLFLRCTQLKNPSKCSTKQPTTIPSDCIPF